MPANFSIGSNLAYSTVLHVLEADQRWFAFDVPVGEARKGRAMRFGMTLWNYHMTQDKAFEAWAITRDPATGAFWYRVGKERQGRPVQPNRKPLWEALQIAVNMPKPFPMNAILKDAKTRKCAPEYVFGISDVQMQADGSALWLKLDVPDDDVGTTYVDQPLPPMVAISTSGENTSKRTGVLPIGHYLAARDAAVQVTLEEGSRQKAIQALVADRGINEGTIGALLNNFRCLVEGTPFKAPMQAAGLRLFIDAIIARRGASALPNVITAVKGYIDYATEKWGAPTEMHSILSELQHELAQETLLQRMVETVEASSRHTADSQVPSEVLKEVWVRGPQHAAFRRELLRRWKGKCSVHGSTCNEQLRASHIVAWSVDKDLRGDVNNGLLLSVPLDSLFDRGLISFDDTGQLIASHKLDPDTAKHFGVQSGLGIAWDHLREDERQALRANLARHRQQHKDWELT